MHLEFRPTIRSPWIEMAPVRLGAVPASLRTADEFVTVEGACGPLVRIDLYSGGTESFCFQEALEWSGWAVVGWEHHVYVVALSGTPAISLDLGSYFGHLYPGEGHLLVASTERLFCLDPDGRLRWHSDRLGIDGIVVHDVDGGWIEGAGEWDPPGGWRPFRVCLATGAPPAPVEGAL